MTKPIKNKDIEALAKKAANAWITKDTEVMNEIQNSELVINMPIFVYQAFRQRVLELCKGR